ncbi:MAG: CPXCG motif-containing cysteine-rich protein [Proteobacteria bacterium]|nr:CPXCG motif-containing cysteine-rich protein [Pseudomonadota bacterium]MCH8117187.1 CPXCG motif-containing cysteine-rich protein [Pseudomonadota bacterium]
MNNLLSERRLRCPFCAESISLLVDTSAGSQSYIEDCQVCCQPMLITIDADNGELHELRVDCAS